VTKKLALGRSKLVGDDVALVRVLLVGDDVIEGEDVAVVARVWRFVKWSEKREGKIFNTFTHSLVSLMVVGTFLHSYFIRILTSFNKYYEYDMF
jgi:hypothetical protein